MTMWFIYMSQNLTLSINNDPVLFSQAIKKDNYVKWLDVMKEELKSINDNEA